MKKWKIGDKILCINDNSKYIDSPYVKTPNLTVGDVFIVSEIKDDSTGNQRIKYTNIPIDVDWYSGRFIAWSRLAEEIYK